MCSSSDRPLASCRPMPCAIDDRHQRRIPDRSERNEADAVAEPGLDAGREHDGQPGLARAAGPGQRQQPGAAQQAARRAEFALPADEARPRPWHATGCLAGIRGPKAHYLSSPRRGDARPPAECAGAPRFDGLTDSGPRARSERAEPLAGLAQTRQPHPVIFASTRHDLGLGQEMEACRARRPGKCHQPAAPARCYGAEPELDIPCATRAAWSAIVSRTDSAPDAGRSPSRCVISPRLEQRAHCRRSGAARFGAALIFGVVREWLICVDRLVGGIGDRG